MSDKPRVGTYLHGLAYPNKLAVYNLDFYHGERSSYMPEPWAVDRGNSGLDEFATFEEACTFVREELSK